MSGLPFYTTLIWASLLNLSALFSLGVWIWKWKEERGTNPIWEGVYISPLAIFGIGANISHLINYGFHARIVAASLEILFVTALCIVAFKLNMESNTPKLCWVRNLIIGFVIWGVMYVLRSYIY